LPDQYGDLRRVSSQSTLVVLVHGGLWRHEWTADTTESIALDLFHRGFSTRNLEYRRVGLGGGWPESFSDIAMALARIPDLTGFSPDQTLVLGHSAGATMALWADHPGLGLALAPFCDLVEARQQRLAGDTFARLLEEPLDDPAAYSPAHRLPRRAPTVIFASPADRVVPIEAIRRYRDAAKESQSQVDLVTTDGGHFDFLEPSTATWGLVIETMEARNATV
jgi:pimeloyl-ACP methyl ester carboxylesterase